MEVLIAMTLLSLLSVSGLLALRVGLSAMERSNRKTIENRRVAGAQQALERQIAGMMAVTADCIVTPDQPPRPIRFFQGEPDSMRFVSSYSLEEASRGYPRILEFRVIPGDDNRGVRLIVNELLYTGPLGAGATCLGLVPDQALGVLVPVFRPIEATPRSFVLADKLQYCRFAYREDRPLPELERWVGRWVLPGLPSALRIDMAPLDPDPSRLQPLAITAPIRVNRDAMVNYAP